MFAILHIMYVEICILLMAYCMNKLITYYNKLNVNVFHTLCKIQRH